MRDILFRIRRETVTGLNVQWFYLIAVRLHRVC
jgi:hypothetical protein